LWVGTNKNNKNIKFNFNKSFYSYYKCKESSKYLCRGSIKIIGKRRIRIVKQHNHLPDANAVAMSDFKKKLKLRSVNETTALINIYEEEARE